jgi:hypothetical protein
MAAPRLVNAIYPNWIDVLNGQAQTGWTFQDQSPGATPLFFHLVTTAAALSVCGINDCTQQVKQTFAQSPTSGLYGTVRDQAVFQLASQNYTRLLAIPGPKESIFESDGVTVDLTNSDVVAFLTQVFLVLGDTYGNPWLSCTAGWRRRVVIGG